MSQIISANWAKWIQENLNRQCSHESMQAAMVQSGISATQAAQWIEQVANGEQVAAPTFQADASRIPAQDQVQIGDQLIHISFRHASPEMAVFDHLLSDTECDGLIALSKPKLKSSNVVDPLTGDFTPHHNRTSDGTYFQRAENALVSKIEARIATLLGYPVENGEGIQVLHYTVAKEYKAHYDFFDPNTDGGRQHMQRGGQRVATLIMYLNDVEAGGATFFPHANISIQPKKGSAVYFVNANQAGEVDPMSLHGGAPVQRGEKWIATKWIRQAKY